MTRTKPKTIVLHPDAAFWEAFERARKNLEAVSGVKVSLAAAARTFITKGIRASGADRARPRKKAAK